MIRSTLRAVLAAASLFVVSPAFAHHGVIHTGCPVGQTFTLGEMSVTGAFARATPKGAQSAGAYLTVSNAGTVGDTFMGATTAAASDAALHSMGMKGNVMQMAPVEGGLEVPPGGSVVLSPMGYHLMLTGMEQPFVEGQCIEMVLHFAKAGDLPIQLNIGGMAQDTPPDAAPSEMPSHDMSGMDMGDMSSMAM